MKLCVLILKEEQKLDSLIRELEISNIKDITILNSHSIIDGKTTKSARAFSSIRHMLNYVYDESRAILIYVEKEQIITVKEVVSSMFKPEQCNCFAIDVESVF